MKGPITHNWLARFGQYSPRLMEAAIAMNENDLPRAEPLLRQHLKDDPFDVYAIRMFAELAGRIGRYRDAENLLRRAVEISPSFTMARANLALVLYRQNRASEAIEELNRVLAEDPDNPGHANLQAAAFGRTGDFDEALSLYVEVLKKAPGQPRVWMSYGHMLKTVGKAGRRGRCLSSGNYPAARTGRSVVELGEPQDRAVFRCRSCRNGR